MASCTKRLALLKSMVCQSAGPAYDKFAAALILKQNPHAFIFNLPAGDLATWLQPAC
jgi:hypothetical protein